MATTKLYLDTRGSAGENGSVKVVISHNRKSAYMNLGLKAPIAKWDAQHLCVYGGENDTVSLSVPSLRHTQRNTTSAGIRCPTRALAFRLRGLGNRKNRLDHRENDSRAVFFSLVNFYRTAIISYRD